MSDDEQNDERNADVLYVHLSNARLPDMGCSQTCRYVLLLHVIACRAYQQVVSGSARRLPDFSLSEIMSESKRKKRNQVRKNP